MPSIVLSWMMILGAYTGTMTNYAESMFTSTSHDFGIVAKGSKTEFDFVFTNKYKEDVEISSVSSSCQCTTPSFTRGPIKSWQKGAVHISVNTKSFEGNKNATITVRFSKPFYAEVQLHSYVFIRSDVFVNPGVVYFGNVRSGAKPSIAVNVSSTRYSNWTIKDVRSSCPFLAVELKQPTRQMNGVYYQMIVRLKDNAPPGAFSEYLELITNDMDTRSARIMVPVEGRIKASLTANPSPLSFGLIEEGSEAEKSLVLNGAAPFRIVDITSEDKQISASIQPQNLAVQVIKLRYKADQPRSVNGMITIYTDVEGGMETQVVYNGKIVPKPEEEKKPEPKPSVAESKPVESKPAADKPAESKPAENQPVASTPAEKPAQVAETPAESKPANTLPSDEVTDISNLTEVLDSTPAEEKPAPTPEAQTPAEAAPAVTPEAQVPAADAKQPATGAPNSIAVPAESAPQSPAADAKAGAEGDIGLDIPVETPKVKGRNLLKKK